MTIRTDDALVEIEELCVHAPAGRAVLNGVSLGVRPGERVGIVGESGAGKTTLALAALGILRPGLRRTAGRVRLAGHDVLALRERSRRRLRRHHTAWLGQDPAAALTPTLTVAGQIGELLDPAGRTAEEIMSRLAAVGLPDDAEFATRRPHQLSGGQQQRLALARALAGTPRLLVLDEPTSRLDPVTRGLVIDELDRLQAEQGFAVLLISHDLDLVARLADHLVVLRHGRQVEAGPCRATLRDPDHDYTRQLRNAHPDLRRPAAMTAPSAPPAPADAPVPAAVPARGLVAHALSARHGARPTVANVDLAVVPGQVLALVGASGSGKTTIARCLAGQHRPDSGEIRLDGQLLPRRAVERSRRQRGLLQLVGPDPVGALHPRRRVRASVARPLRLLHGLSRAQARTHAEAHLARVGLGDQLIDRLLHELSGGERQRVAIARALAARPQVVICDEITSALDPTIAGDIIALLDRLRRDQQLAVVFITHDLALAARFADTIAVLEAGHVVEHGPTTTVLHHPTSPVARHLVDAMPSLSATLTRGRQRQPVARVGSSLKPEGEPV